MPAGDDSGVGYEWQGKFKWHQDARKYGTPTIWFLSPGGRVLTTPLFGNDYNSEPPQIHYGYRELQGILESLLEETTPP